MANINLLPWRDEFREKRKKEFLSLLALLLLAAVALAYFWVSSVESGIATQQQRNNMLDQEIKVLQKRVVEIKELKRNREALLDRMRVIQDLQGLRPVIVRSFDEFVRMVPDGIYILTMKKQGDVLSLEGITESNNRVSSLMRNLENSSWFEEPNLNSVEAMPKFGETASKFSMTVKAAIPKNIEGES